MRTRTSAFSINNLSSVHQQSFRSKAQHYGDDPMAEKVEDDAELCFINSFIKDEIDDNEDA